jgi:serine/threonine-protein kinase
MSPEQLRASRDVDARTDIWSLGVILFELVCGEPPFQGNTIAEIGAQVLVREPPSMTGLRADVPPDLEAIVRRCLAREPEHRFQSIDELVRALVASAEAPSSPSPSEPMIPSQPLVPANAVTMVAAGSEPARSSRAFVLVAVALAMLALIGLGLVGISLSRKKASAAVRTPVGQAPSAVPEPSTESAPSMVPIVEPLPTPEPATSSSAPIAHGSARPRPLPRPATMTKPSATPAQEPSSRPGTPSDRFNAP